MKVNLSTVNNVKEFVEIMNNSSMRADLISGRYIVDSHSIMGIFSLDLTKPVELVFHERVSDEEYDKIKKFIVE